MRDIAPQEMETMASTCESTATYEFTTDPQNMLVRLVVSGFWNEAVVDSFERDYRKTIGSLKGRPYRMIVNAGAYDVPPQNLMARFNRIAEDPAFKARYVAVITRSAILKMQIARAFDDSVRTFSSEGEAVTWLLSQDIG